MSGIAGIIRFDGAPVDSSLVEKMTAAMPYRGPDGINHWVKGSVALGQCMMCTTPESLEETQPHSNEDESLVLVMDGWLSNWMELRTELLAKCAVLRSRADAELVLRAYQIWGSDCLRHIDGDFAFVIWDERQREVFCARDRMGNKPLYYHWNGRELVFASELAPILAHPSVPEAPNEGLIAEFLAGQWFTRGETLWIDVFRLIGAHNMRATVAGLKIELYWAPNLDDEPLYKRDEEYFEHYEELFADCVRRASRSQNPVAFEVSGGLDSSAVFCVAEELFRCGRLTASSIEGYTLDFTGDRHADEIGYARSVANHLGRKIREVAPFRPSNEWFRDRARTSRNFPGFPNGIMLIDMYCQMTANGHRVVVSGEGGDEWLAGTRLYYAQHLRRWELKQLYSCLKHDIAANGRRQAMRWLARFGIFAALPRGSRDVLREVKRNISLAAGNRERRCNSDSMYWLSPTMRRHVAERRELLRLRTNSMRCSVVHSHQLSLLYSPYSDHGSDHAEYISSTSLIERRMPMNDHRFVQF
ncbi:MAG: asparagine synthase-related protein, partial [Candidatus Binataceae bacterium]